MRGDDPEILITVGESVSATYWGMLVSLECRVPAEAVEGQWRWRGAFRLEVLLWDDDAMDRREFAPLRRDPRGRFDMSGSVEKAPRFPISVDVLSIEATEGASMSCFNVVADPREGPRDVDDSSEARLLRPEALISRSGGSMMSRSIRSLRQRVIERRMYLL